ncbi:carbohydrate esterase family 5 protein [Annulohypoxylon maeteangense]|uniref:carbohydrate esterase family 5 protein n=1 Tax=Annulohypoxylon maeteangense TaxID=1927788 RepID=UPI0020082339|nr:carbohydrate esterase family 5 protein [Annulohypoxylon maeteangense]KAI0889741.1 carbohydrate esterase family 5 protein [Annulohypoxylon maeteangense]
MRFNDIIISIIATASAADAAKARRANCPNIHIIGARETTAPPGFGSAQTVVDLIQKANNGATSESIVYPAAGGNSYASSVSAGVLAVANQTNTFNQKCPDSKIVVVGYSQGAQIVDDAFCGGPDGTSLNTSMALVSTGVSKMTAAIILMGDPRHVNGLPYNVGNATAGGFAARPVGYKCPAFENIIQAYCDAADPFCAKGDSQATHQGYGREYGQAALRFVQGKLGATNTTSASASSSSSSAAAASSGSNSVTASAAERIRVGEGYVLMLLALGGLALLC